MGRRKEGGGGRRKSTEGEGGGGGSGSDNGTGSRDQLRDVNKGTAIIRLPGSTGAAEPTESS